jgi:hypothetical protein
MIHVCQTVHVGAERVPACPECMHARHEELMKQRGDLAAAAIVNGESGNTPVSRASLTRSTETVQAGTSGVRSRGRLNQ